MLKFENIAKVGDRIRAYDFEPRTEIGEIYVEGTVVEENATQFGAKGYRIRCDKDVCTTRGIPPEYQRIGIEIFVPYQVAILEFDNRVRKL